MKHILSIGIIPLALIASTQASDLNIAGVGTFVQGSGTAADLNVGDVVLYSNIGTDDNSTSFDAILTVNQISSATTLVDATRPLGFVNISGTPGVTTDIWADLSIAFISSGSSTAMNPLGDAITLTGVSAFTAQDIDSNVDADMSDVVGLFNAPGPVSFNTGTELENAGFEINTEITDLASFDFARVQAAAGPDWTTNVNVLSTLADNHATWNYSSADVSEFRVITGYTGGEPTLVVNRGLLASITFETVVVPEPTSTALLGLGGLAFILRRRR